MFRKLRNDIACILERDPAARSGWEVLTCYPGLHAIYIHKLAHWFWRARLRWLGRFTSQFGRWLTGIEIHRGAKRHPTLGEGVVVGAGAKVLGGFTVGDGARIGSNAVVVKEVPAGATVVGIPGRIVEERTVMDAAKQAERFSAYAVVQENDDPYAKAIQKLVEHSQELEKALAALNEKLVGIEKDNQKEQLRAVK